eukprot:6466455-Amphidinium_carterae.1
MTLGSFRTHPLRLKFGQLRQSRPVSVSARAPSGGVSAAPVGFSRALLPSFEGVADVPMIGDDGSEDGVSNPFQCAQCLVGAFTARNGRALVQHYLRAHCGQELK